MTGGRCPALPDITAVEAVLLATLHTLPARQREALVLRYHLGLPDTQIAAAMGISTRAVNKHIGRGMSSLQAAHRNTAPPPLSAGQP